MCAIMDSVHFNLTIVQLSNTEFYGPLYGCWTVSVRQSAIHLRWEKKQNQKAIYVRGQLLKCAIYTISQPNHFQSIENIFLDEWE